MTAIIVNDKGESFVGWGRSFHLDANGWERTFSVPHFAKPVTYVVRPNDLRPHGLNDGDSYTLNHPYVFSTKRSAIRTMRRIYGCGQLAVVV